jgi:hypothetical protein
LLNNRLGLGIFHLLEDTMLKGIWSLYWMLLDSNILLTGFLLPFFGMHWIPLIKQLDNIGGKLLCIVNWSIMVSSSVSPTKNFYRRFYQIVVHRKFLCIVNWSIMVGSYTAVSIKLLCNSFHYNLPLL